MDFKSPASYDNLVKTETVRDQVLDHKSLQRRAAVIRSRIRTLNWVGPPAVMAATLMSLQATFFSFLAYAGLLQRKSKEHEVVERQIEALQREIGELYTSLSFFERGELHEMLRHREKVFVEDCALHYLCSPQEDI